MTTTWGRATETLGNWRRFSILSIEAESFPHYANIKLINLIWPKVDKSGPVIQLTKVTHSSYTHSSNSFHAFPSQSLAKRQTYLNTSFFQSFSHHSSFNPLRRSSKAFIPFYCKSTSGLSEKVSSGHPLVGFFFFFFFFWWSRY